MVLLLCQCWWYGCRLLPYRWWASVASSLQTEPHKAYMWWVLAAVGDTLEVAAFAHAEAEAGMAGKAQDLQKVGKRVTCSA